MKEFQHVKFSDQKVKPGPLLGYGCSYCFVRGILIGPNGNIENHKSRQKNNFTLQFVGIFLSQTGHRIEIH